MKRYTLLSLMILCGLVSRMSAQIPVDIHTEIDLSSHAADISKGMYGVFFEEINHAGEGGLYGELLQNRSFEDSQFPVGYKVEDGKLVSSIATNYGTGRQSQVHLKWNDTVCPGWNLETKGKAKANIKLTNEDPYFNTAPTSLCIDVHSKGDGVSLINNGFWGIAVQKNATYRIRAIVKSGKSQILVLRLINDEGKTIGKSKLKIKGNSHWIDQECMIKATASSSNARFSVDIPSEGKIYLDYVSLFPTDTYKKRKNGMRKDVALMIDSLKPKFLRWPGGCVVEGITLNNRIKWKETLGDPASRPGEYDLWGYRNSYGYGYHEFLDFCEDLEAKAMFVCNVGMACTGQTGETCSDEDAKAYIQDALDAIEYAIGDTTTLWGKRRANEGHPKPYPLQFVEIGNENFGPIYDRRYNMFYQAIKAKYPELTLISNYGMDGSKEAKQIEMVDPHWYVEPERFFRDAYIFDNFPRNKYKFYVGEYSCNDGVGSGNILAALSEAAFLTGCERNGDIVKMLSYAPLFEHKHDRSWPVNLIWISNDKVMGRSSYYVQKMFSQNLPSYNLISKVEISPETLHEQQADDGYIMLKTLDNNTEYKNLTVNGKENSDKKYGEGTVIEFDLKRNKESKGLTLYWGMIQHDLKKALALNIGHKEHFATVDHMSWNNAYPYLNKEVDSITSNEWHHVKFTILYDGFSYSVDGKEQWKYQTPLVNRKFLAAGYDTNKQEVVVKVVNAKDTPCSASFHFTNGKIANKAILTTLKAIHKTDENTFEQPRLIYPYEDVVDNISEQFNYTFEPNSVNILRVKCRH